ncbi:MAG: lipid-binding SYLF domain-containing protein [Acidobacteria bacterium]|nr:lipid-binding SYLF domain-containing protein [Acidobacteriota bacterium]
MQRSTVKLVLAVLSFPVVLSAQSDQADRVRDAAVVLQEIMGAPDKAIPKSVLEKAEAVAVFPGTLKGGFVIAAHRGRGIISVRDRSAHRWSKPAFLTLTGGSIGAQIGGQSIDIVLIVMNRRGLDNLLQNQFKIGASAGVAAGPVGRDAQAATDIQLRAEILSYSRSRGLFAGVSLEGSGVRQDRDWNEEFYGDPLRSRSIVIDGKGTPKAPDVVRQWVETLSKYAGM